MPVSIKKSIKLSLLVLVIAVALLLLAPLFIDAEDFKPVIIKQVEQSVGRKVEIGDISASLFPWVGVRLEDVKIANREGFSDQPFLTVGSLDVEMALLPLFSKRIEIRRFVLESPHLLLERNEQGIGNWQNKEKNKGKNGGKNEVPAGAGRTAGGVDSAVRTPEAVKPGPAGFALASFTAEAISIHRGRLAWVDAATGAHAEVSKLQLSIDSVRLDSPVPVHLSGMFGDNAFRLEGHVGPVGNIAALDIGKLPVQAHLRAERLELGTLVEYAPQLASYAGLSLGVDVQFEQRPDGLQLSAGSAQLAAGHVFAMSWKLEMPAAGEALLRSLALTIDDRDVAQMHGEVRRHESGITYKMQLSTPEISRQALSSWLPQVDALYAAHTAPWQRLKLGMLVSGNMNHLDFRDLQLLLDDELVQASGMVRFGKRPDVRLRVAARTFHANPWLPAFGLLGGPTPVPQPVQRDAVPAPSTRPEAIQQAESVQRDVAPAPSTRQVQPGALIAPAQHRQGAVIAVHKADPAAGQEITSREADNIISRELVQGDVSGTPEPDLRFLVPWRVAVQVQAEKLFLHGLELKHVRASLSGKQGKFQLNPLTFELAGGQVREHASVNAARYPARWTESSTVSGMRIQPVLAALADMDLLRGVAEMKLNLAGRGLLPGSALNTLSGSGNVLLRDGQIRGFNIPGMLRRLRMLGRETGPKYTDFTQLAGSFVINGGVVNNDDLFMASPLFRLTGHGRIDLPRQSMDYHIKPRLVGTLTGQGDTAGVRKGMSIPIHLVGPISSPMAKLEMNIQDLIGNLQGVIEQIEKGGKAGGIKKVLEKLFPKR